MKTVAVDRVVLNRRLGLDRSRLGTILFYLILLILNLGVLVFFESASNNGGFLSVFQKLHPAVEEETSLTPEPLEQYPPAENWWTGTKTPVEPLGVYGPRVK